MVLSTTTSNTNQDSGFVQQKLSELGLKPNQIAKALMLLDNDNEGILYERISNLSGDVLRAYVVCKIKEQAAKQSTSEASELGTINENDLIKIISQDNQARLDIGVHCVKEEVPAYHNSWATRLQIKRLDGPNEGFVNVNHVIGIFSEDGKTRLDLGERAMKKNGSVSHESWATRLHVKRLQPSGNTPIKYGEIIGLFSECGRKRLDIGERSMKENVPAHHDSWATRLRINKV